MQQDTVLSMLSLLHSYPYSNLPQLLATNTRVIFSSHVRQGDVVLNRTPLAPDSSAPNLAGILFRSVLPEANRRLVQQKYAIRGLAKKGRDGNVRGKKVAEQNSCKQRGGRKKWR